MAHALTIGHTERRRDSDNAVVRAAAEILEAAIVFLGVKPRTGDIVHPRFAGTARGARRSASGRFARPARGYVHGRGHSEGTGRESCRGEKLQEGGKETGDPRRAHARWKDACEVERAQERQAFGCVHAVSPRSEKVEEEEIVCVDTVNAYVTGSSRVSVVGAGREG
jgi:hypothetical protein